MSDHKTLSAIEADAARKVLDILCALSAEQAERVLAHVQDELDVQDDDIPMFSRGISSPLGKQDIPLKTKVDEVTHTLWLQRMRMLSTDTSTVFRNIVYLDVHGRTWSDMVLEKMNHDAQCAKARAALIGPIGVPEFGGRHG